MLDEVLLGRIQFAFTMTFHILFPAFTIGLASWLAMLEFLWLRTGKGAYLSLYRFWLKIFAVSFGLGVVSGIVMSFQFGTNWSAFSEAAGNVIGPLLGYEVMTAFFLEATFLGIMLFGAERVGRRLHFFSTCMVALGTLLSSFWILAANSWMHTPAGFTFVDGVFYPENWFEIIFNPSFPYRFVHMVMAAFLSTCFIVAGVAATHPHLDEQADDAADHLVAEGVGGDLEAQDAVAEVVPAGRPDPPDHHRLGPVDALGLAAERREVVLADERVARRDHRPQVERFGHLPDEPGQPD